MKLIWLMLAGALGAAARYGLTTLIQSWLHTRGSSFPLSTLLINVSGALLLSFLATLIIQKAMRPEFGIILGTGFLGAFTTFSTFELESEKLLSSRAWLPAAAYILGNLILGFAAIFIGRAIALRLLGPGAVGSTA